MVAIIILLVLGAVMSTVFIVSKVINYTFKTIIFKTIASLFFVAVAVVCLCLKTEGPFYFKLFTIIGLSLGLLGDVLLGFKYITTKTKKIWILAGMFAFAFGHIAYFVGLLISFYVKGNPLYMILSFTLPIILILGYMVVAKKAGINFGKGMLLFAIFYLYCLTAMVSTSFSMALLHRFSIPSLAIFFAGSLCFMTSDFMLTGSYFKEGKRSKAYNATYSIFYYVAQFLIALSLFFIV